MNRFHLPSLIAAAAVALLSVGAACAAEAPAAATPAPRLAPRTPVEQMGYAIGVELASKFKKEKFDFDVEMAAQGLRDAMADKVQLTQAELEHVLKGFQAEFRRKLAMNRQMASMANRERNETFFNRNKVAEGVKLLPSGVQYRVLKEGSGRKPSEASTVTVRYVGRLLDGSEFDRSVEGQPTRLKVASLVHGWRIAMMAMPVGAQWQVWIPAQLAYGDRGTGTKIGPQEPLVLEIELLDTLP